VITRIDHELARLAAEVVPDTVDDDLHARFAGLPAMIMTSGLAATGAYLLARYASAKKASGTGTSAANGNTAGPYPYRVAAKALLEDAATFARIRIDQDNPNTTLDNIARERDSHRLLLAEARARLFVVWLARIAAARRVVDTTKTGSVGQATTSRPRSAD